MLLGPVSWVQVLVVLVVLLVYTATAAGLLCQLIEDGRLYVSVAGTTRVDTVNLYRDASKWLTRPPSRLSAEI